MKTFRGSVFFPAGSNMMPNRVNEVMEQNPCYSAMHTLLYTAVVCNRQDFALMEEVMKKFGQDNLFEVIMLHNDIGIDESLTNGEVVELADSRYQRKITPNCPCCFHHGDVIKNMGMNYVDNPTILLENTSNVLPSLVRNDKESRRKGKLELQDYNACRNHCKYLWEVATLVDFFPYKFGDVTPFMVERMSGLIVFILAFIPKHMDENALYVHRLWRKRKETFIRYLLNSSARFVKHLSRKQSRRWIKREDLYGSVRVNKYTVKPLFKLLYERNPEFDKENYDEVVKDHADRIGNFQMRFKTLNCTEERHDKRFKNAKGIDAMKERDGINPQQLSEDVYGYAKEIAEKLQETIDKYKGMSDEEFISYNTQMCFRDDVYKSITNAILGEDGNNFGDKSFKISHDEEREVTRAKEYIDFAAKRFAFTFQTRCKSLYQIGSNHQHDKCIHCGTTLGDDNEDVYFYFEVMECLKSNKKWFKKLISEYEDKKSELEKRLNFSELVCIGCVKKNEVVYDKLNVAQIAAPEVAIEAVLEVANKEDSGKD